MFIFASPKQPLEEQINFSHNMELARQRWILLRENLAERRRNSELQKVA